MDLSALMAVLLSATALVLAARVYSRPRSVIFVGPLFLITANVLLPAHARFADWGLEGQWEMYVWAAGILLITLAPIPKLGLGPFFSSRIFSLRGSTQMKIYCCAVRAPMALFSRVPSLPIMSLFSANMEFI